MNIYQHIEISSRELDSKLLLAVIAASRGHQVVIGNVDAIKWGVRTGVLKQGIFHTKCLTPSNEKTSFNKFMLSTGNLITSIDEEAGLVDHGYERFAIVRYSDETIGQASAVFAWGSEDTETLKRIYPQYANRIHQTGSPRADQWKPCFTNYWGAPKGMPKKPFLLVSSNMGSANAIRPFHESIAYERLAGYFQRDPDSFAKRFNHIAEDYRMSLAFIEAIRYLAAESEGDYDIVLRPHPVENIKAWKVYLADIPNVHVIREGSITAWVNNAIAVMHNGCTTAVEATISGTPVVTYVPFEQEYAREIPNDLGIRCQSLEALSSAISRLFHLSQSGASLDENVELPESVAKKVYLDEEELAAQKIVKVWESLDNGELSRLCDWTKYGVVLKLLKLRALVGLLLRTAFPRKFGHPKENYKFPPMDAEDIRVRVRKMQHTLGLSARLHCKLLSDRTVLIRPK